MQKKGESLGSQMEKKYFFLQQIVESSDGRHGKILFTQELTANKKMTISQQRKIGYETSAQK